MICNGEDDLSVISHSCGVFTTIASLVLRINGADFEGDRAVAGVVAGALGTRVDRVGDTACICSKVL